MTTANSLIVGFVLMVLGSFAIGTFAKRKDNSIKSFFFENKEPNVNHIVN